MFGNKSKVIRSIKKAFNDSSKRLEKIQNQCDLNAEYSDLKSKALDIWKNVNTKQTDSDTNYNFSFFESTVIDSNMTQFTESLTKYVWKPTSSKLSPISAISFAKSEIRKWGKKYDETRERVKDNFGNVKQFVKSIITIEKLEDFKLKLNGIKDKIKKIKSENVINFYSESKLLKSWLNSDDVDAMNEEDFKSFLGHIEKEMTGSIEKYFPGFELKLKW